MTEKKYSKEDQDAKMDKADINNDVVNNNMNSATNMNVLNNEQNVDAENDGHNGEKDA